MTEQNIALSTTRTETPKRSCVRDKDGILIDDEQGNVDRWGERAYLVQDFAEVEKVVERLCKKAIKH